MSSNNNDHTKSKQHSRNTSYNKLKISLILLIAFIVVVAGAGLGFLAASIHTLPSLKSDIRPPAASQFYDVHGKLITTTKSAENRIPVSINKIPKNLQNAFIAVEDARFYQHSGIDPRGIVRAIWANITNRGVAEGGSTITQQLAKNALLSQERTLKRKIQEAFLAIQLERQYTKSEILELYLNQIYFGQGAYGVQAAAQVYFGKDVENLNLAECALLAGIPKSPNYYSPHNNLNASIERQYTVLDQMLKYNYIDLKALNDAKQYKIKITSRKQKNDSEEIASYFIDYVTQILIDKYGTDTVYKDGLKVYTTLDLDMQHAAEKSMSVLPTISTDKNGIKQPQGALVAIDPRTGHIKAMVGGRGQDQFNRAALAERQPGSAFKPFVYLAAIESGMSPLSVINDSPVNFGNWTPVNYDGKYHGNVTLRTALENSLNVPTVKLAQQVGIDKVLYYAQQMGISTLVLHGNTNDRNLASSLGGLTKGVIPLEIASAYGVLANQGIRVEPIAIVKVTDRNGKILEQNVPKEKIVLNERSAYIVTDMMRGVITHGTGVAANIGRPAAGKTGTTSDYKDAWFVGFTPDLVTAVWIGCDNEGYLPGITGGHLPAQIWSSFMSKALANIPIRDFIKPGGLVIPTPDPKTDEPTVKDHNKPNDQSNKENKDKLNDNKSPALPPSPSHNKSNVLPPSPQKVPPVQSNNNSNIPDNNNKKN